VESGGTRRGFLGGSAIRHGASRCPNSRVWAAWGVVGDMSAQGSARPGPEGRLEDSGARAGQLVTSAMRDPATLAVSSR
jgi:hypothetical protein